MIYVTDVTLHCAISHQVMKSIKKLEERRSTLLFYHSKLQHVKTLASWQTPLKYLSMCCSVYNKDYWNFFELFIHVTSIRDLRLELSRTWRHMVDQINPVIEGLITAAWYICPMLFKKFLTKKHFISFECSLGRK